jgi:transposase
MDTNSKAVIAAKRRGTYRHHPLALKRLIVEETLQPGASVARIARQHGVNANQVFLWRKAYREGLLPESGSALLPVTVTPSMVADQLPAPVSSASTDCLTIDFGQIRVRIEGRPDAGVLRLILAELQRR